MARQFAIIALFAVLAAPLAAAPAEAGFSGPWVVHGDFGPKLRYDLLCAFRQDGAAVSGPCMAVFGGAIARASGSQWPETLEFEYGTTYQGQDVHLTFQGRRGSGGQVMGQVTAGPNTGSFDGAPVDDAGGAWLFNVHLGAGFDYQLLCGFRSPGRVLRGPCAAVVGPVLQATGSAPAGGGFELAYDTDLQGQRVHVTYKGALQGDGSVKGVIAAGGAQGVFTAKRR